MVRERSYHESLNIPAGDVGGWSNVHKFGANRAIPNGSYAPLCFGGIYRTPQVSGATKLRWKAGNVNDTPGGSGCGAIELQGLDATGALVIETIATNGNAAGPLSAHTYLRLFRMIAKDSGTYATTATGSHAANLVVENAAGTEDWGTLPLIVYPMAQSLIGCYSVPLGKRAFMPSWVLQVDSNKTVTFMLFVRENILQTAPPYSGMNMKFGAYGVAADLDKHPSIAAGPFAALTDIIWMATVAAGAGIASVDFEIALQDV